MQFSFISLASLAIAAPFQSQVETKSFLVMGDWGSGNAGQARVASIMNQVAIRDNSEWVMAIGDNFYNTGVQSTSDSKWKSYWKSVYTGRLAQIPWYAVLGNHDWYGNPTAQIQYNKVDSQWNMPDHFYTKTSTIANKTIAFIFIDSDLMFYGLNGFNLQRPDFSKLGWTTQTLEAQFKWIEQQLQAYSKADYLFVMGHHNAVICGTPQSMPRLVSLLEKYRVNAYFFGHEHSLGFTRQNNVNYVLTGSGGQSLPACGGNWRMGNTYGFVNLKITANQYSLDYVDQTGAVVHNELGLPRF